MKRILAAAAVILLCGCGGLGMPHYDSMVLMQPFVVSVDPVEGQIVPAGASVSVEFSMPILRESVNSASLAILPDNSEEIEGVVSDLKRGRLSGMHGLYQFSGDDMTAIFRPISGFEPGERYLVVATEMIRSQDGLPFNQKAGRSPAPFVGSFRVEWYEGEAGEGGADGGGAGEAPAAGIAGPPPKERPAFLVINEILYDAVGRDTEGDVFIELYGEPGKEISDYRIELVRGSDGAAVKTLRLPKDARLRDSGIYVIADSPTGKPGTSNVPNADFIRDFDPRNGPDCLQLIDDMDELVDALGYGEPLPETAQNGLACYFGMPAIDVGPGQSLSRVDGLDTRDNLADFIVLDDPTPGDI